MKFVTTTRSEEQRIFETAPEVKDVLGRPRSRWKNKVVTDSGKELQIKFLLGEKEEEEEEDNDNNDKKEVIFLLCIQGLIFSTETSHHKSTSRKIVDKNHNITSQKKVHV
jgi:hypothetical protein